MEDYEILGRDGVYVQSHCLIRGTTKHSDDCYRIWVTIDTPYRLIRGEEANCLLEDISAFSFCSRVSARVVNEEMILGCQLLVKGSSSTTCSHESDDL